MCTEMKCLEPPQTIIAAKWVDHFEGVQGRLHDAMGEAHGVLNDYADVLEEFRTSLSEEDLENQAKRLELVEEGMREMHEWVEDADENLSMDLNELVFYKRSDEDLD